VSLECRAVRDHCDSEHGRIAGRPFQIQRDLLETSEHGVDEAEDLMKFLWGAVLIALGIVVIAFDPFGKLDAYLRGTTDHVLTAVMLALAGVTVALAFIARPSLKALIILWIIAP
jgi:hypothetical protein